MILIHPYARDLRNDKPNPKNYPYWKELISMIDEPIIQIGTSSEKPLVPDFEPDLPLENLAQLVEECRIWIGVDSFFQHFCWDLKKPGVVLWGQSDPIIFGHPENINLLKDRKYLREKQFWLWEQAEYRTDCWVSPDEVIKHLNK
jgi:ADP-heptose:LPS heptosyltransferase